MLHPGDNSLNQQHSRRSLSYMSQGKRDRIDEFAAADSGHGLEIRDNNEFESSEEKIAKSDYATWKDRSARRFFDSLAQFYVFQPPNARFKHRFLTVNEGARTGSRTNTLAQALIQLRLQLRHETPECVRVG